MSKIRKHKSEGVNKKSSFSNICSLSSSDHRFILKNVICFLFCLVFLLSFFLKSAEAVFNIALDTYTLDFGNLNPGEVKTNFPESSLIITCTTDQGNAWNLRVRNETPFTHTINPAATIPDTSFWWYGVSTTGTGTLIYTKQDFTTERIVYSAPAGEGASGVEIRMKFEISIPDYIQSGGYESNIIFTMVE
jgi:hypothetical protein